MNEALYESAIEQMARHIALLEKKAAMYKHALEDVAAMYKHALEAETQNLMILEWVKKYHLHTFILAEKDAKNHIKELMEQDEKGENEVIELLLKGMRNA